MKIHIPLLIRIFFKTRIIRDCALAIAIALCLLAWGMSAGLKTSDWASWVQAFGAIVAIAVAFQVGARQSRATLEAIVLSNDYETRRKYEAYAVIAQAAHEHSDKCLTVFGPTGFNSLSIFLADLDKPRQSLIDALNAIPVHEVGTFNAVESLVGLRITMGYLSVAVKKANEHVESFGSSMPFFLPFDTGVIRLNCEMVKAHATNLTEALRFPVSVNPTEPANP